MSSQVTDAHHQGTSVPVWGNHSTLPGSVSRVNSAPRNLANSLTLPHLQHTFLPAAVAAQWPTWSAMRYICRAYTSQNIKMGLETTPGPINLGPAVKWGRFRAREHKRCPLNWGDVSVLRFRRLVRQACCGTACMRACPSGSGRRPRSGRTLTVQLV